MNKGTKIFLATIILILLFMLSTVQGNEQSDIDVLIDAFNSSNAEIEFYSLQFSDKYGKYINDKVLLKEGNEICSKLGMPIQSKLVESDGQNIFVSIGCWGADSEVSVVIKRKDGKSEDLFIIFKLIGDSSTEDLRNNYYHITKKLQENLINIKINSCIQGKMYVNLNTTGKYALTQNILQKLEAEKVESYDSDLVKSISAFLPSIENYIWTGDKKMNFQISTHYDSVHQKTILTMGTPIINIEY